MRIFISSVQKKFAAERKALAEYLDKAHEAQDETYEAHVLLTPIEIGLLAACATTSRAIHELLGVAGYTSRTGNFKRSM